MNRKARPDDDQPDLLGQWDAESDHFDGIRVARLETTQYDDS